MNGKKAKMLRKLAGVVTGEPRKYFGVENTIRNKEVLNNITGEVLVRYQTATYQLHEGSRILYKMLKRNYLGFSRAA